MAIHEFTPNKATESEGTSYGQIVNSTSMLGIAQVVSYLASLLRNKVLAVMLGVPGIGTAGLYQSIHAFVQSVTNLGVATSGVREIAAAGDKIGSESKLRTAIIIERISCITGIFGLLVTWASASMLSRFIFQSGEYTYSIALVGPAVFFTSMAAGRSAILQGLRRIPQLARVQIICSILGVPIFLSLCWWLGLDGIVPSILVLSIVSWLLFRSASRHDIPRRGSVTWSETWAGSQHLLKLGVAMMWNVVISGALAFGTRALIVRDLGIDSNGIFQAAWTISGMFIGFILSAMSMDFLPRLTAAANDRVQITKLVNEQTEIGLLMSFPGLLATTALAPLLVPLLFTEQFTESAILIPWFIAGCLAQVVSWPLAYIQIAKGEIKTYVVAQTLFNVFHLIFIFCGLKYFGLVGVAAAFPAVYLLYTFCIALYFRARGDFQWSSVVLRLIFVLFTLTGLMSCAIATLPVCFSAIGGTAVAIAACVYSIAILANKLESNHFLNKVVYLFLQAARINWRRS